jgi:hypothetical protein
VLKHKTLILSMSLSKSFDMVDIVDHINIAHAAYKYDFFISRFTFNSSNIFYGGRFTKNCDYLMRFLHQTKRSSDIALKSIIPSFLSSIKVSTIVLSCFIGDFLCRIRRRCGSNGPDMITVRQSARFCKTCERDFDAYAGTHKKSRAAGS